MFNEIQWNELYKIMIDKNINYKQLAEQIGVSPAALSRWKDGVRKISLRRFIQIIDTLDLTRKQIALICPELKKKGR